jgi:hypothetical protein
MHQSKKIDCGESWEAAFGENAIPTPSKGKSGLEKGERIPTEKGDIFAGHLRGQFAWA